MSWEAIVTGNLRISFMKHLDFVETILQSSNLQNNYHISHLLGKTASTLFFSYHKKDNSRVYKTLHRAMDIVNTQSVPTNNISGLAGLAWTINHLEKFGNLKTSLDSILKNLDAFLFEQAKQYILANNFDFFDGMLGIGFYLLERLNTNKNNKDIKIQIEYLVRGLEKNAIIKKNLYYWQTTDDKDNVELGLAHGQASILVFLAKVLTNSISQKTTLKLMSGLIELYTNIEIQDDNGLLIPDALENSEAVLSPLRWCHGHLGVALAMWQAGHAMKSKKIKQKAIKIGMSAAKMKGTSNQYLPSAIICHGTLGVAHMFNRLYQYSKEQTFKHSAIYWYEETDQLIKTKSGYKHLKNNGEYAYYHGLLYGVEGIGLGLSAAINTYYPKWDSALLLS